jgi:hypothetical protein
MDADFGDFNCSNTGSLLFPAMVLVLIIIIASRMVPTTAKKMSYQNKETSASLSVFRSVSKSEKLYREDQYFGVI